MFVKKQIPRLSNLYLFFEKLPLEFFDEIDIDRYFNHETFDISQSHHRIPRVSKNSSKKPFQSDCSFLCIEDRAALYRARRKDVSDKIVSAVDNLRHFLKKFVMKQASVCRFQHRNQKTRLVLQSQKTFSWLINIKIRLNIQIPLLFRFPTKKTSLFSIKNNELQGIQFMLTEIINLNHHGIQHAFQNRFCVESKCELFQSI